MSGQGDEPVVHLYSNTSHDESEYWCAPGEPAYTPRDQYGKWINPTHDPAEATCLRCLSAAAAFGEAALVRLGEVQS